MNMKEGTTGGDNQGGLTITGVGNTQGQEAKAPETKGVSASK